MSSERRWPDDLEELEQGLLRAIADLTCVEVGEPSGPLAPGSSLTAKELADVFDAQLDSRHLDHTARWLRAQGLGFYTIGSAGHEANALVATALRPTDPALLHYRSGGFYLARARQVPGHDGVRDVLLGLLASADEPIAGGRHKVFGHVGLAVLPQTSTIASHLPRAMGVAFAIGRARRLGVEARWPADAIAVTSFGDASLNHSTAQGALNAASYTAHQGMAMPLLFVCEDNGWGISVPTPAGWVEASLAHRPDLRYERVDGTDPIAVHDVAEDLADWVRSRRRPALLHLPTVRYGGHAGTDVESGYRSRGEHPCGPVAGSAAGDGPHVGRCRRGDAGRIGRAVPRRPRRRPRACGVAVWRSAASSSPRRRSWRRCPRARPTRWPRQRLERLRRPTAKRSSGGCRRRRVG